MDAEPAEQGVTGYWNAPDVEPEIGDIVELDEQRVLIVAAIGPPTDAPVHTEVNPVYGGRLVLTHPSVVKLLSRLPY